MPFRLNTQQIFLTYAQCSLTKEEVLEAVEKIYPLDKYLVATETHQDGNPHIHLYGKLFDKINITNERVFDIGDRHPNVAGCRSANAVIKYCAKGGNYISNFYKCSVWARARDASSAAEAVALIKEEAPRDYWLSSARIEDTAQRLFKKARIEYVPRWTEFPFLPEDCLHWAEHQLPNKDRALCLVMWGPTRLGKTEWARSLGKHIYWRNNVNLDEWDDDAEYLVIDDIDFKWLPAPKSYLTCMGETTVTDKYMKKVRIFNNKPCIYIVNEDMRWMAIDPYWGPNTFVVNINFRIF